jgi:hypothetical protein
MLTEVYLQMRLLFQRATFLFYNGLGPFYLLLFEHFSTFQLR